MSQSGSPLSFFLEIYLVFTVLRLRYKKELSKYICRSLVYKLEGFHQIYLYSVVAPSLLGKIQLNRYIYALFNAVLMLYVFGLLILARTSQSMSEYKYNHETR